MKNRLARIFAACRVILYWFLFIHPFVLLVLPLIEVILKIFCCFLFRLFFQLVIFERFEGAFHHIFVAMMVMVATLIVNTWSTMNSKSMVVPVGSGINREGNPLINRTVFKIVQIEGLKALLLKLRQFRDQHRIVGVPRIVIARIWSRSAAVIACTKTVT